MSGKLETYEGMERTQAFVARRNAGLWAYCKRRHREYWLSRGVKHRAIPDCQHEGERGWWFPELWTTEYGKVAKLSVVKSGQATRPPKPDIAITLNGFPGLKEFRRWDLPPGTIINAADATVTYPNGFVESWGEARRKRQDAAE